MLKAKLEAAMQRRSRRRRGKADGSRTFMFWIWGLSKLSIPCGRYIDR